jgi:protein-disulfide isomerase
MKIFASFLLLIFFSLNLFAQTNNEILATANNQNFTSADLPPQLREAFENRAAIIANMRKEILFQQIANILLEAEAAALKTSVDKMIAAEMQRRVPNPTEAQIQAVYDANREQIGNRALAEVRPQIISFLRREQEEKALMDYVSALRTKHKVVDGKDVNAAALKPADVLATIGAKTITVQNFEEKARPDLHETEMEIYEHAADALEEAIFSALVTAEAKSLNLQPEALIAREISDKMKDFSDEEREQLTLAFQRRLFQKYNAKILIKEPAPFVYKISIPAGAASRGAATAPVTVVMFTDLQCPACAAAHPVLEKIVAEYGGRARLVVRHFPLTRTHENAFKAAEAASAAHAQGKFFEYADVLYKNQNALDTASLKRYAAQIGLNQKQFDTELDSGKYAAVVRADIKDGENYNVTGTPTVFVNGVKVRHLSAGTFRQAIERALKK